MISRTSSVFDCLARYLLLTTHRSNNSFFDALNLPASIV